MVQPVFCIVDTGSCLGSFLVRHTTNKGGMDVLSVKYFSEETEYYKFRHYSVNNERGKVYFNENKLKKNKFDTLRELVNFYIRNKTQSLVTTLTTICHIPHPHSDPGFKFSKPEDISLEVPYSAIELGRELGRGHFGTVHEATYREVLKVAVKKVKLENQQGVATMLKRFFEPDTLKTQDHPNLVQNFAFINDKVRGIFIVQELMDHGSLRDQLKKWREQPHKMKQDLWSKILSWMIDVARGMKRLESLHIVHKSLTTRYSVSGQCAYKSS